ncbi:MAG: cytochrome c-type biogenesis protein CcmH [Spongiibacteraceae bacterium]|jgi:cytochrome c-type biogenesis protein CcmH|nr:cytochrome c-type biogenesis protein CcmH [Spongiibacteraceae bacterium]
MSRLLLSALLGLAASLATAAIDPHQFETVEQQERYQRFTAELRCPKCQNQNLAGSDAEIAADLRRELRRLIDEGYSDQQIIDFMVARYGEFVLYRPPLDRNTVLLWAAPVAFGVVGFAALGTLLIRRRRSAADPEPPLDAAEAERVRRLLEGGDELSSASRQPVNGGDSR